MENILKEKRVNSKDFHDTRSNLEEVERMTSLVNELLLLSRLDTANSSISLTKVNLTELLQSSVKRLMPYAKSKQVSLTFYISLILVQSHLPLRAIQIYCRRQ